MSDLKPVKAFGYVTPDGEILQMTSADPKGLYALFGGLMGRDESAVRATLDAKGYRVIEVLISPNVEQKQ